MPTVQPTADDRMLTTTRALSIAIIPFLVVAFVVLYGFPFDTARLFAWEIKPPITPMILGAVYLGGSYFFFRAARTSQWHTVKVGFVPVTCFASLMGVSTVLHWEKFNHTHPAFWLWVGLYFTTPMLVFAVWATNRTRDVPVRDDDLLLPGASAMIAGAVGVAAALTSSFLMIAPERAIAVWPWTLTPLTARVTGAIFALGVAGLYLYVDRRWTTARIMLQVELFMLVLILLAAVRARADFDTSRPLTWIFAAGFVATTAVTLAFYLRMEAKAAPPPNERTATSDDAVD